MQLKIYKSQHRTIEQRIDYASFLERTGSPDELLAYNELLGRILKENSSRLDFLVSPTLARMEAQTYLFDTIFKCLALQEKIVASQENLEIVGLEGPALKFLAQFCQGKQIPYGVSRWPLMLYELKQSFPWALARFLLLWAYTLFLNLLCRFFLPTPWRKSNKTLFISFYDYRAKGGSSNGLRYQDPYFKPLQTYLQDKKIAFDVVLVVLGKKSLRRAWGHVRDVRQMGQRQGLSILEQYLGFKDFAFLLACRFRPQLVLTGPCLYKGHDLTGLLNLFLREDFRLRNNWFFNYMVCRASARLLQRHSYERIIYPWENHCWEKLWILNRNRLSPGSKMTGYQHTSFSLKLLNHFPSRYDRELGLLPDKLITVGKMLREFLIHYSAFPAESVVEGCALRHAHLFAVSAMAESSAKGLKTLAFAFSSDAHTYPAIIKNLQAIFRDVPVRVYLKPHPLFNSQAIIPDDLGSNFINAKSIPWSEIFPTIDLLLYHDNSLGVEAFKYGVPSCSFEMDGDAYSCLRVFNYQGFCSQPMLNLGESRQLVARWSQSKEELVSNEERQYMSRYFHEYFHEITGERLERFLN